jgi:hypothetical protein
MGSRALQQMVHKIFNDNETKEKFLKDPESVIAGYTLTGREKKAVLTAHARVGLVTNSTQLAIEEGPFNMWL